MIGIREMAMILAVMIGLGGCGFSPPLRYHALSGGAEPGGDLAGGAAAQVLVELLPVVVPERLNRAEIVLGGVEGTPIEIRDGERWAAPLSDEMRQRLDDALWRRLRAADVYRAPLGAATAGLPLYRLALRLERFDAAPGRQAVVEGSWTLRRLPQGAPAVCRAAFAVPITGNTTEAVVAALTQGAGALAGRVADSLGRQSRGEADVCVPDGSR